MARKKRSKRCKFGKLAHPKGRRRCKKRSYRSEWSRLGGA